MIERAIDRELRASTKFDSMQCGFKEHRGVAQPLLRYQYATRNSHRAAAVLDLRCAYPSVPRGKLLVELTKRLPENLTNMVTVFLSPDSVNTVGDEYNHKELLKRGVPEGSPLSPAIFNLYIDSLAARLRSVPNTVSRFYGNCYADDVLLLARDNDGLQELLDVYSQWARSMECSGPRQNAQHSQESDDDEVFL